MNFLFEFLRNEPELKYFLLRLINLFIFYLDKFLDKFFDFSIQNGWKSERISALRQGKSAHIYRHLAAAVLVNDREYNRYQLENLLLVHEKYVKPEFVLENDNVFVWEMDKNQVMFAITKPEVNLFDVSKFTLAWTRMSHEAQYVLVMDLDDFHKVADKVGNPRCRVSVLHMSHRCGSTLISHMMHQLPRTRSVAEIWLFWSLEQDAIVYKRSLDQVLKLVQSTLRFICRQNLNFGGKIDHVFIKLTSFESQYIYALPQLIPDLKLIFNTRMPKPSMRSWGRMCRSIALNSVYQFVLDFFTAQDNIKHFVLPFPLNNERMRAVGKEILEKHIQVGNLYNKNYEELYSLLYMATLTNFLEHKELYKLVVLYEDLTEDPRSTMTKVFEAVEENMDNLELALAVLDVDAHKGNRGGGTKEKYVVPKRVWDKIDDYARKLHFPITLDSSEQHFRNVLKLN